VSAGNLGRAIFIVGVGRSGTSLLHALLSTGENLCVLQETGLIRRRGLRRTLGELQSDHRFYRNSDLFASFEPEMSLKEFYLSLMKQYSTVLDKDPGLITHISEVFSELGSVTFVHIIRDPINVIESKKKAAWSKGRHFYTYALIHAVQLLSAKKAKDSGIPVIEIFYEDVLANPWGEISKIGHSMQIDFDEKKLERHGEYSRVKVFSDEKDWKGQVNTNIRNYKRSDSSTLSNMQHLTLAHLMMSLGYPRYSRAIEKPAIRTEDFFAWATAIVLIIFARVLIFINVKKML
jgi:hypothetical protein